MDRMVMLVQNHRPCQNLNVLENFAGNFLPASYPGIET